MASSKGSEAKVFLKDLGLEEYIEELVEKHKFETLSDLRMLAKLEDKLFKELGLPLCVILKIKSALEGMEKEHEQPHVPSIVPRKTFVENKTDVEERKPATAEIPKSRLLELGKKSIEAQFANSQYNLFNGIISQKVKKLVLEKKWHGAGALRVSAGTSLQQAQENSALASNILDDEELKPLYNIYHVPGHGQVSLTRKKGISLIGNKLSHMRKPTAYFKKDKKERTAKKGQKKAQKVPQNKEKEGVASSHSQEDMAQLEFQDEERDEANPQSQEDMDIELLVEEEGNQVAVNNQEEEECELEKRRRKRIEENNQQLMKLGVVPKTQAIMFALFYLKINQINKVQMKHLKTTCKALGIKSNKNSTKENLLKEVGENVFKSKLVQFRDEDKAASFENLMLSK